MNSKLFKIIIIITSIVVALGIIFFITTSVIIGLHIRKQCTVARDKYNSACVPSLISTLGDESNDFRTRNDAIWALGQLGDERSAQTLESYYTGKIPDREPLDQMISQYELRKAIILTNGGINGTAWVWRWWVE